MHKVLISLAANINHKKNLCRARKALAQILSLPVYSKELWTEPEGSSPSVAHSRKYLNQLVRAETSLSIDELNKLLKATEVQMGRTPEQRQQGLVPIDLDLLEYDGTRYHLRDWQRSYMKIFLTSKEF